MCCERCKLLGTRIETTTGPAGKVTAIALDGSVEFQNEKEGNRYRYWVRPNEIKPQPSKG